MNDIRKVKKFHKGRISIHEINAIQTAYFSKLTVVNYASYIGIPGILFGFFTHLVFFYWPATGLAILLGLLYGYLKNMPNLVKKNYYNRAYIERNRFINNCTQLIVNENLTLLSIFEKIIPRLKGELYDDITVLLAKLTSADEKMASKAFKEIIDKYEEDVVYSQFFEQLETAHIEGRTNIETFKELKKQHNTIIGELDKFQDDKSTYLSTLITVGVLVTVIILMLVFAFSQKVYIESYAHQTMGIICNSIFLLIYFFNFNKSMNYIYDDSITTLE